MAELFKYITEIFISFFDLIKKHLDEIIYGGILGGILTYFIIYFFTKIKYGILFLFSNVLKTKRQKLESIHVEGATIINKQFLKNIQLIAKKQNFKADDFYLAKQYENCQWYGILNNWDIERDAYKRIKEELKNSFVDEFRQPKIIAFIHGRGGSGKSTLLRRIAVDSIQEDFCTLWVNDKEISKFYEKGISNLGNYSKTKFLIIIEDWYRIKQNTPHAKEIVDSICNYSNVRIVIGDRTLDYSVSREHIFNPDENIIELKVNENKNAITKILEKVPHWKETAETLLISENDYDSTLYLILWVIARTYQDKNKTTEKNTIRKEGLTGHFQTIVESDLRIIAKHFPGFAKALYYYGSIYSEDRIYIGLDTFLSIADLFNEKVIDNRLAFTSNEIRPILNIYINTTKRLFRAAGNLSLVAFNHDILTDEGLFKAQIAGWHRFDDSIKLQILPVIIDKGDDPSASIYFFTTINKINIAYFPNEDRLKYLNILIFDKKNRGYYLNALFNGSIIISETEKVGYISTILNDFLNYDFSAPTICICLNQVKNLSIAKKTATYILSQPDFFKLHLQIVSTAMKISKDEKELKKAATDILSQPDFFKLPESIVSTAMKISKDEKELKKAATDILSQPDFFKLHHQIVSTAMKISKDEKELKKAATDILSQPFFFKLPESIVSTAMKISKDEKEQKKAATDILSQPDFFKLPDSIVSTAMKISKDEKEQKKAATYILSQPNFFKLPYSIVSTAMKISKDEKELKKAATDILSQPNFFEFSYSIISTALMISKDISKATYFLNNWENRHWSIIFQSLNCFAKTKNRPQIIIDIVNTIIKSKNAGGINYLRYCQILRIPFHGVWIWEKECDKIISNYKNGNISNFNSVLSTNLAYPNKIKKVCETILMNWKDEITRPIKLMYGATHYGDNIKIALGHPYLKILAKQTAQEMQFAESEKPGSIREYLLEIVHSIISNEKYPEWTLDNDENMIE